MVIWTRWGILGLLIPVAIIVIAMIAAETIAKQMQGGDRKSVKQAPATDGAEEPTPEDPEEVKAAERKRADDERKQTAQRDKMIKRANAAGYLIGGVASAAVLWPLGRWMNKRPSGDYAEEQARGWNTLFFIPLEYWGFIWAAIGLVKFLRSV